MLGKGFTTELHPQHTSFLNNFFLQVKSCKTHCGKYCSYLPEGDSKFWLVQSWGVGYRDFIAQAHPYLGLSFLACYCFQAGIHELNLLFQTLKAACKLGSCI